MDLKFGYSESSDMTQAFLFERCGQRVYTDPLKTPEIE